MDKEKYDCVITCGNLDESGYRYIKDEDFSTKIIKHNVSMEEAKEWHSSWQCILMCDKISDHGRLHVSHYWTTASNKENE